MYLTTYILYVLCHKLLSPCLPAYLALVDVVLDRVLVRVEADSEDLVELDDGAIDLVETAPPRRRLLHTVGAGQRPQVPGRQHLAHAVPLARGRLQQCACARVQPRVSAHAARPLGLAAQSHRTISRRHRPVSKALWLLLLLCGCCGVALCVLRPPVADWRRLHRRGPRRLGRRHILSKAAAIGHFWKKGPRLLRLLL